MNSTRELRDLHEDYLDDVRKVLEEEGVYGMWEYQKENIELNREISAKFGELTSRIRKCIFNIFEVNGYTGISISEGHHSVVIRDNDLFENQTGQKRISFSSLCKLSSEIIDKFYSLTGKEETKENLEYLFNRIEEMPDMIKDININTRKDIEHEKYEYIESQPSDMGIIVNSEGFTRVWNLYNFEECDDIEIENAVSLVRNKEDIWDLLETNRNKINRIESCVNEINDIIENSFNDILVSKKL
jgi:hypothetical protein